MEVCIRRMRLKEILVAVRDLEKRGFECVSPIRKFSNSKKIYRYDEKAKKFCDFHSVVEYDGYIVRMRKDDRNERSVTCTYTVKR